MSSGSPPVRRVDGRYTVREQVGSGGFATVWRAEDDDGGPDIAVKFPKDASEASNDEAEIAARFRQEYDSYSQFEGAPLPSSIARFVTGSRSDPAYIGMEFLRGDELGDVLGRGDVSPGVDTARTYGFPVVRALVYLHHNDICHLDCKPDNVMVRAATDAPALIDFNTVSTVADAGGTLFHEDGYKPPEQTPTDRRDDPVGPWSDVYAVGKLLCYLLTGEARDTTDTPEDGLDPTAFEESCPSALGWVVQKATRASYRRRHDDAAALFEHLREALGEPTVTAGLTDFETGKRCLVRPGDTVGRITDGDALPTITVEDTERHISPIQFSCAYDDGWQIRDRSLNGTYVNVNDEWVYLLSDEGYERLAAVSHERVADGRPYAAANVHGDVVVSPVDPSYPLTLTFETGE